jgi:Flp pilus assembly protein TadG
MRREDGQGVVEFAMVLPFIAGLILIFIQFGIAVNYWIDLTHVANEGARQAAVGAPGAATAADFKSAVCSMLETGELRSGSGQVDAAQVTVAAPSGSTHMDIGDPVKITVVTHFHWLSFWRITLPFAATTVQGSATMRLERDARTNPALTPGTGTCP